jgi:hypothetical protein
MGKIKSTSDKRLKPEAPVKLNMSFQEAMKKALNTKLPKKELKKKK